ncbi:hypothetical protein ACQR1W_35590 [Bradyrhizobium sp. HKCCYLS1011]|uniref:hypothetical protein n=1 Tax=Bradyrhizobium sp. HKCCYLS1011 TaxID=3420733 RepID=UPI003EBA4613
MEPVGGIGVTRLFTLGLAQVDALFRVPGVPLAKLPALTRERERGLVDVADPTDFANDNRQAS